MPAEAQPAARRCLAVVLAAGEGTRMRSHGPKVLHAIAGRSMLAHALTAVQGAGAARVGVVIGPGREDVAREARVVAPDVAVVVQRERKGTAHAVLAARELLTGAGPQDDVVVAFADTPLVTADTYGRLRAPLAEGAAIAALAFRAKDPSGYGRMIERDGKLAAIREHKDANSDELAVTLCNAGLMAVRGDLALGLLEQVGNRNAQGEYYLTDLVALAVAAGHRAVVVEAPEDEVQGINDRVQLSRAEAALQRRLRAAAMTAGATLIAPDTVFLCADTRLGRDVLVEPHVVFGPKVAVEDGAVIHAFSHLEGATVAAGATVGPFARLRPGAMLGPGAKVGNFVEIKATTLGKGAKVSHLTYLGDATVGANANIGAGTITCNYDGIAKHRTEIGQGAFIGSNAALVAPVRIGEGAFVGSGSVVTEDVPADALALARGRQVVKDGWAREFRARAGAAKTDRTPPV